MSALKLGDLQPRAFENLVFDLLTDRGFHNLTWRTPGSDGGRDLEAHFSQMDPSGYQVEQKWHIECKRYSAALSWPQIYEKVAHAHALNADFLLVVTSSSISTQCEDRIQAWNEARHHLIVRVWNYHDINKLLMEKRDIATKYGLDNWISERDDIGDVTIKKIHQLNNSSLSSYVFGRNPELYLELSSALSELYFERRVQVKSRGKFFELSLCRRTNDLNGVCARDGHFQVNLAQYIVIILAKLCLKQQKVFVHATDSDIFEISNIEGSAFADLEDENKILFQLGHLDLKAIESGKLISVRKRKYE